ncbi:MAG: hypothetical protein KAT70_09075 [Thermoplasmata archaeon]|nr:hypothetical protein [Thermoplasmata archaeon]
MGELFGRTYQLTVDTIRFTGLDISFEVEKSTKHEPNKCKISVFNLTRDHQRQLEGLSVRRGQGHIRVELMAGYAGDNSLIFRGDLRTAKTLRDVADAETKLEGEDGGRAILWARINRSFPAGTRVDQVVRACAQAMGVGLGNTDELTRDARLQEGGNVFSEGTVLEGSAANQLTHILRSVGLRYSVQNGALQILRRGEPLQATAIRLSSGTGLVGSPEVNADGTVAATCLMLPDLYPGRRVQFEGENLSGTFRVERANYLGDTLGDAWYIKMECQPLVLES